MTPRFPRCLLRVFLSERLPTRQKCAFSTWAVDRNRRVLGLRGDDWVRSQTEGSIGLPSPPDETPDRGLRPLLNKLIVTSGPVIVIHSFNDCETARSATPPALIETGFSPLTNRLRRIHQGTAPSEKWARLDARPVHMAFDRTDKQCRRARRTPVKGHRAIGPPCFQPPNVGFTNVTPRSWYVSFPASGLRSAVFCSSAAIERAPSGRS